MSDQNPESIEKQRLEIAVAEKELQTKEFFQGFSGLKRGLFFALVILIIPAYFLAKFTVAYFYLQNVSKNQVTAHAAVLQPLNVNVIDTHALSIINDSYSAYALIKNPNKDLSAKDLNYTFKFYDAANNQIGASKDRTYLLGGEQKYLVLANIKLKSVPQKVTVEIENPVWKRKLLVPNVLISKGIPQYADSVDPMGFAVQSTISNQSTYTIGSVKISGVLFNRDGKVIGVNQTVQNSLLPKEIRGYKLFWPIPLASQVALIPTIIVETNVLDLDNLK
ncbi:MAG: hypothetical protein NVSMB66_4980 [Candidatus Doudnabacteria bacterium]